MTQKFFLIVGNTRVGSTWLATSLHFLPGIRCRREIRWRLPYQGLELDEHVYLDGSANSVKNAIRLCLPRMAEQRRRRDRVKIQVGPIRVYSATCLCRSCRETGIGRLRLLLTRSYFETWQSWKAIGIRHLANPNVAQSSRDSQLVKRMIDHHSSPVVPRCVVLTAEGVPLISS